MCYAGSPSPATPPLSSHVLMPSPPILPRTRPSKTYTKLLKHAWRPPSTPEQRGWTQTTLRHLRHSPLLPPDGWLPLSHFARPEDTKTALAWTHNDRLRRFETEFLSDPTEDTQARHAFPYIRARAGHSVPVRPFSSLLLSLSPHSFHRMFASPMFASASHPPSLPSSTPPPPQTGRP